MKEGEFCKKCDTALMDVEFNKVGKRRLIKKKLKSLFQEKYPDLSGLSSACILCHEYFLETIQRTVTFITNMQNRPNYGRGGDARGGQRGGGRGRGRGRGGNSRGRGPSRGGRGRGRGRN